MEHPDNLELKVIARLHSAFPTKFGLPRQSGLVEGIDATIVFEPDYRFPEALRGIEDFTHLWLVWGFSGNRHNDWSPTVRPPRLGGNTRMGVFATRSPFRPNPLGLSCVKLIGVEQDSTNGTVLRVAGVDMMDGTPIYDIKPYIPYADCHPDASQGFTRQNQDYLLEVVFPEDLLELIPAARRDGLIGALAHDPRPAYQRDPERVYGFEYAGFEVRFSVSEKQLTVREVLQK
ncbi:MAG: tRNA (N6-threonylcarbamoyladenosine(37)-N6)-methyltransferase TrmO [Ruminococcaceae bacterium]|nr:tRNA (N6-threonylcarbamoyladenosine(37)-N6)-methyltransferase TrmO [Oscillospiraceae bacterium]